MRWDDVKALTRQVRRRSLNDDGTPVNSGGRLQVPQLRGVEEGVRARSIDRGEAWRQRSPWLGGRRSAVALRPNQGARAHAPVVEDGQESSAEGEKSV
jgi:ribosome modulation factor